MDAHTKLPTALARSDRLSPEDLRISEDSRSLWRELTDNAQLMARMAAGRFKWTAYRLRRTDNRSDPLELLAMFLVALRNAGAPEAFLRRIPQLLNRIIDDCFVGNAVRSVEELDRAELSLEQRENTMGLERYQDADVTPEQLDAEATAIDAEIALETERSRALRRLARQKRSGLRLVPC